MNTTVSKEKDEYVSIIMPIYNSQQYLSTSIESILGQSFRDFRLICLDDGSSDCSGEVVKKYCEQDARVTLISNTHHNAGYERNVGIKLARGKYVYFFDSDDCISEDFLSIMVNCADNLGADVVICDCFGFSEDEEGIILNKAKEYLQGRTFFSPNEINDYLFQITAGWAWDKLFRKSLIDMYKITFQDQSTANDAFFTFMSLIKSKSIAVVDTKLVFHRVNVSGSIENVKEYNWKCAIGMLESIQCTMASSAEYEQYKKSFLNFAAQYLVWYACSMSNLYNMREFFNLLKKEKIRKLGLLSVKREDIYESFYYDEIHCIEEKTFEEYLLHSIVRLNREVDSRDKWIRERDRRIFEKDEKIKSLKINKHWYFSEENYPQQKTFVIYGYGRVGRDYARQLVNSKHSKLVAIIDKNYETIDEPWLYDTKVGDLSLLSHINYDFIIISPRRFSIAKEMKSELLLKGIQDRKIICTALEENMPEARCGIME